MLNRGLDLKPDRTLNVYLSLDRKLEWTLRLRVYWPLPLVWILVWRPVHSLNLLRHLLHWNLHCVWHINFHYILPALALRECQRSQMLGYLVVRVELWRYWCGGRRVVEGSFLAVSSLRRSALLGCRPCLGRDICEPLLGVLQLLCLWVLGIKSRCLESELVLSVQ